MSNISNFAPILTMIGSFLLPAADARCETSHSLPKVGEEYEISTRYETSQTSDEGGSGSSSGRDAILERVIGVHDGGLELEYDLPKNATAEERSRYWQYPARVFELRYGPIQLLNRSELETRVDYWLKAAGWTRDVCGRWIFTWNMFRIECDPQSVIETIELLNLRSIEPREGAPYRDTEARGLGTLRKTASRSDGASFNAAMEIDPDVVRRARAEADVAIGEVMQKPVTLEAALRERVKESVLGTISITLETDLVGNVWRRSRVIKMEIKAADGRHESHTRTETVERHLVSANPNSQ